MLLASAHEDKIKVMNVKTNVLGPTSPNKRSRQLSTVCIPRRRQLRALAGSTDQFLERFGLRFCLVTRAQDCHGAWLEVGLDIPLKEIEEGDEGEAMLVAETGVALI